MIRPESWPGDLAAFFAAAADKPFVVGRHDCCTLLCDAVLLLTGVDPMADLREAYSTEAEADALIDAAGGLAELVATRLAAAGLVEIPPAMAGRGDVAVTQHGNTIACGVIAGPRVAVPGPDRLAWLPRRAILRAWKAG